MTLLFIHRFNKMAVPVETVEQLAAVRRNRNVHFANTVALIPGRSHPTGGRHIALILAMLLNQMTMAPGNSSPRRRPRVSSQTAADPGETTQGNFAVYYFWKRTAKVNSYLVLYLYCWYNAFCFTIG